ncbi:MAG: ATP-binding protein [Acidobacteria bacterium]|nr:ATP-binding protein [Acidobacteriota bacterium]
MIKRKAADLLLRYAKSYPVVTVTGPRQSGKTTMVRMTFPRKDYVNLENLDTRTFAREDPRGFLAGYPYGAILDEIQHVPQLLSYIQTLVDEKRKNGMFILTGSAQLKMMESVSQSLAGRTALIKLLPFDLEEAYSKTQLEKTTLQEILYRGFYPRIFDQKLNPSEALSFYLETYIQRDVRTLLNVSDLLMFERFMQLCAGRTAQPVNFSSIASDLGISSNTVSSWISVLQASFIIELLPPYHQNLNKRITKAPKLYFIDVGLASFLLRINKPETLHTHPLKGQLFESFVISEILKYRYQNGQRPDMYFFRDKAGNEADLILNYSQNFFPIEIKSSQTYHPEFTKSLRYLEKIAPVKVKNMGVVYGGERSQQIKNIDVCGFRELLSMIKRVDNLYA